MQQPEIAERLRAAPERIAPGVRALDLFATCRTGQRLGLFAGSGVGKSTLMAMLAQQANCDVIVLALVGERGRELREFLEDDLGPEGLARSVVIVATSDQPPLMRREAAYTAMAVAEHFRDQGTSVLLLMDSVTRAMLGIQAELTDLVRLGAYRPGADPAADAALRLAPQIERLRTQGRGETSTLEEACDQLAGVMGAADGT